MRTAIIILAGFVLWAACIGVGRMSGGAIPSMRTATLVFVGLWFIVAATNLWVGVTRAGYALRDELPIFLLIFLLPVAVAVIVKWKVI
jgi:hypothetical protein